MGVTARSVIPTAGVRFEVRSLSRCHLFLKNRYLASAATPRTASTTTISPPHPVPHIIEPPPLTIPCMINPDFPEDARPIVHSDRQLPAGIRSPRSSQPRRRIREAFRVAALAPSGGD